MVASMFLLNGLMKYNWPSGSLFSWHLTTPAVSIYCSRYPFSELAACLR